MILNDIEQMKLHDLLRQQGNLTSDGCWDAIEVFEKFLKDKQEPLSDEQIAVLWFERAIEKAHGIGE